MIIQSVDVSAPCDVRVYWNRGNPEEAWCVDFGRGTVVLLGASVSIGGLTAETRTDPEADPTGWLSVHGVHQVCLYGREIVLFGEELPEIPARVEVTRYARR